MNDDESNEIEDNRRLTPQKVKQMPGWENMSNEMAASISNVVKKFAELFYITIARDMSLSPIPESEVNTQKLETEKRTKTKRLENS